MARGNPATMKTSMMIMAMTPRQNNGEERTTRGHYCRPVGQGRTEVLSSANCHWLITWLLSLFGNDLPILCFCLFFFFIIFPSVTESVTITERLRLSFNCFLHQLPSCCLPSPLCLPPFPSPHPAALAC